MQIDPRSIPATGWTPTVVPEFPCCPPPELEELAEAGRTAGTIDELVAYLKGSFASTLFAFGQVLRDHLPPTDLTLDAADIGTLFQGSTEAAIHHGNLTINGDVQPPSLLLVTGNLTVNGRLDDTDSIAILGNLHVQHVASEAWFIVGGNCVASGFVFGVYNDCTFEVLGKLHARAVITDDHSIHADDGMVVAHAPSEPGVNWEADVFDMWVPEHAEELLSLLGTDVHAVVPVEKFEDVLEE